MIVGFVSLDGFSFEALYRHMRASQETQIDKFGACWTIELFSLGYGSKIYIRQPTWSCTGSQCLCSRWAPCVVWQPCPPGGENAAVRSLLGPQLTRRKGQWHKGWRLWELCQANGELVQEVSEEREGVSQELSGTFSGSHRCHDRDLCFRG